jgi:hypothetical protein
MRAIEFILEGIEEQIFSKRQWPQLSKLIAVGIQRDSTVDNMKAGSDEGLREVAMQLIAIDPTKRGSYAPTIIKWYGDGDFILGEDAGQISLLLQQYEQLKPKLPVESRDITRLTKTQANDAVDAIVQQNKQAALAATKMKQSAQAAQTGARDWGDVGKVLMDDGDFAVVVPQSVKQARNLCKFPQGAVHGKKHLEFGDDTTTWCTLSSSQFESYSSKGPLYNIILHKDDPVKMRMFQLNVERDQFKNEADNDASASEIALLSGYPGYTKLLNSLIKKHYSKYFD